MPDMVRLPLLDCKISARVQSAGGPVSDSIDIPEGLKARPILHLLILVHGFSNDVKTGKENYDTFVPFLMPGLLDGGSAVPDAIARLFWPGDEAADLGEALKAYGYPDDVTNAKAAAARLDDFVRRMQSLGVQTVSIIAHSLGCRLVLELLRLLGTSAPNLRFGIVSLMAAAAPTALVGPGGSLLPAQLPTWQVLKLFSEWDVILRILFPAGQWASSVAGVEPEYYDEAIGLHGNPASFATGKQRSHGHSKYWSDETAADYFLAAVDPTYVMPRPAAEIASRDLPDQLKFERRVQPSRQLPK
jgi:pimeloyl-ACP methyl ester carboxylesterase